MFAGFFVASSHAIHVGRRPAEIRDIAFEAVHGNDLTGFAEDALFGAAGDELALMS